MGLLVRSRYLNGRWGGWGSNPRPADYEAWIRLRDLLNLYLAGGHVPGPWPSRLRPPGYGPKTERWKHLSIDQGVLCRL